MARQGPPVQQPALPGEARHRPGFEQASDPRKRERFELLSLHPEHSGPSRTARKEPKAPVARLSNCFRVKELGAAEVVKLAAHGEVPSFMRPPRKYGDGMPVTTATHAV